MKIKLLPIMVAVTAILIPISIYAEGVYAEGVLETQPTTYELTQSAEPVYDREQPLILTPDSPLPNTGLKFTGYARYGLHYTDDFKKYVEAEGQLSGASTGRLGNEGNGGEFQFTKVFVAKNGAIWDIAVMLEHWGNEVGLKKFYAGVTNIFESQPNAYLWAGRDFHQRPQEGLNDYFMMMHDGQGTGIYNIDLGSVKLDFSAVAQIEGTGDNGNYAFTSKLHGIDLAILGELSILTNYGFSSDQYNTSGIQVSDDKIDALQIATILNSNWPMGSTKFTLRYAKNADNSVFNKTKDLTTLYASFSGNIKTSNTWNTEYLISYHDYNNDGTEIVNANNGTDTRSRSNYSAIIRPMYTWDSVYSTWLEAGYSSVDYDGAGKNSAWKVTLSQNISFDIAGARPMIRFYATLGEANNEESIYSYDKKQGTLSLGAMFESWW